MGIAQKAAELTEKIIDEMGFELVDTEYVKEGSSWVLRLYVDKPGGINIDECETVSRAVDPILDAENIIKDPYVFEVSSPGLDRPFKTDRDFERYRGELTEVTLYAPVDGKKDYEGYLEGKENGILRIKTEKEKILEFDMTKVASVRRAIRFN